VDVLKLRLPKDPTWITWDGDGFPRQGSEDSIIFFLSEHVYFDSDISYRRSLASAIQQEGVSETIGAAHRLIDAAWVTKAGYSYLEGERFPTYYDLSDEEYERDATFVEVDIVY
jgi:hypothetical protein